MAVRYDVFPSAETAWRGATRKDGGRWQLRRLQQAFCCGPFGAGRRRRGRALKRPRPSAPRSLDPLRPRQFTGTAACGAQLRQPLCAAVTVPQLSVRLVLFRQNARRAFFRRFFRCLRWEKTTSEHDCPSPPTLDGAERQGLASGRAPRRDRIRPRG